MGCGVIWEGTVGLGGGPVDVDRCTGFCLVGVGTVGESKTSRRWNCGRLRLCRR